MASISGLQMYNSESVVEETSKNSGSWRHWRYECPKCEQIANTIRMHPNDHVEWLEVKCNACGNHFAVVE